MSKTAHLTPVASRRIQTELREWQNNPPEGCLLDDCEDLTTWRILMQGPDPVQGLPALYADELYRLQIKFTANYPLEAPEVIFLEPSPIHPHIYSNGHICLDILYDGSNGGWSPALTINKVCLSLRSMLASNTNKTRPPGDMEYCRRVGQRSPKQTNWAFHDDKV